MKYKHHPLNNTVIRSEGLEHSRKIIFYWKNQGVDVSNFNGTSLDNVFYGITKGLFDFWYDSQLEPSVRIATLEELQSEEKKYPRRVMAWDYGRKEDKTDCFLIAEFKGLFICTPLKEEFNKDSAVCAYEHIEEIPEPKITELTLKEVADKFGVPVDQLRIKE